MFKTYRKEIIISLVGSAIFFIFLQPILELLWTILKAISLRTYAGYVDNMYEKAATYSGPSNSILYLIFFTILTFIVTLIMVTFVRKKRYFEELERKINLSKVSVDERRKNEEEFRAEKREFLEKVNRKWKVGIWVDRVYLTATILYVMLYSFQLYVELSLITDFEQRMTIITPYVQDDRVKILKSQWGLMKSRRDFQVIDNEIQNIAKANKIILPELLIK